MNGDPYRAPAPPELEACPHCTAKSVTVPSAGLRWVCGVCGGARVPGLEASEHGESVVALLARAKSERMRQRVLVTLAVFAGAVGAFAAVAGQFAFCLFLLPAVLLVASRAKRHADAFRGALDEGWAGAAERIAAKRGGSLTAAELAAATKIPAKDAAAILEKLSVRGARVSVDDDAELHYRVDTREPEPATEPASAPPTAIKRQP